MDATIIWDLEDDVEGNVQHLREHDVTIEEAELLRAIADSLDCPLPPLLASQKIEAKVEAKG